MKETTKPEILRLSDEEVMKYITRYDAPPEGFDPFTAHDRLLRKHGFPRRPHPVKEPELKAIWDRAFQSKPTYVKAQVSVDPIMSRRKRPLITLDSKGGKFRPGGWAGAVQPVSRFGFRPPEPVVTVYGEWFIPTVTPIVNEPSTGQTVGFWVGIDGFGNNQVLQAGSAATLYGNNPVYWVWTEWFPIGAIQINNFPIKPGDYLTVLVCANTPNNGFCSMMNKTTNQVTSIGITNPPVITSIGATAEWIVEGISDILPVFSTTVFNNCSAGTKTHKLNAQGATVTEIKGNGGANLTTSSVLSDTRVMVKWLGSK
jgi:hypothetical protein